MSVGPESTWSSLEAGQSTRIKRCNRFPHYKTNKQNDHKHHTVDITLSNDKSLLNFVSLTGVGSPNELASIGENSTFATAWLQAKKSCIFLNGCDGENKLVLKCSRSLF